LTHLWAVMTAKNWKLGWTELEARLGRYRAAGNDVYEPSLGSTAGINQLKWSKGPTDDREDEHDGRKDCYEDEGAQCDDEGAIEQDTSFSDDEVLDWHSFSSTERKAIEDVADKLRVLATGKDQGPAVHSSQYRRGVVSRIY
jgi:hypothetical protein